MTAFIGLARVETMLKDFDRLRRAIRTEHDIEAAERALDKCERWFYCIDPNPSSHMDSRGTPRPPK